MNPLLTVTIVIIAVTIPILGGALVHRVEDRRNERNGYNKKRGMS